MEENSKKESESDVSQLITKSEQRKEQSKITNEIIEKHFQAHIRKLVNKHDHYARKYKNFPKLPRIFKLKEKGDNLKLDEINRGHTMSVISGYKKRVYNFIEQNISKELLQKKIIREVIEEKIDTEIPKENILLTMAQINKEQASIVESNMMR